MMTLSKWEGMPIFPMTIISVTPGNLGLFMAKLKKTVMTYSEFRNTGASDLNEKYVGFVYRRIFFFKRYRRFTFYSQAAAVGFRIGTNEFRDCRVICIVVDPIPIIFLGFLVLVAKTLYIFDTSAQGHHEYSWIGPVLLGIAVYVSVMISFGVEASDILKLLDACLSTDENQV